MDLKLCRTWQTLTRPHIARGDMIGGIQVNVSKQSGPIRWVSQGHEPDKVFLSHHSRLLYRSTTRHIPMVWWQVANHPAKMAKGLQVQVKSYLFVGSDNIIILRLLPASMIAFNVNCIHLVNATCLFHCLIKCSLVFSMCKNVCLKLTSVPWRIEPAHYCKMVSYVLNTYANEDINTEAVADVKSFR